MSEQKNNRTQYLKQLRDISRAARDFTPRWILTFWSVTPECTGLVLRGYVLRGRWGKPAASHPLVDPATFLLSSSILAFGLIAQPDGGDWPLFRLLTAGFVDALWSVGLRAIGFYLLISFALEITTAWVSNEEVRERALGVLQYAAAQGTVCFAVGFCALTLFPAPEFSWAFLVLSPIALALVIGSIWSYAHWWKASVAYAQAIAREWKLLQVTPPAWFTEIGDLSGVIVGVAYLCLALPGQFRPVPPVDEFSGLSGHIDEVAVTETGGLQFELLLVNETDTALQALSSHARLSIEQVDTFHAGLPYEVLDGNDPLRELKAWALPSQLNFGAALSEAHGSSRYLTWEPGQARVFRVTAARPSLGSRHMLTELADIGFSSEEWERRYWLEGCEVHLPYVVTPNLDPTPDGVTNGGIAWAPVRGLPAEIELNLDSPRALRKSVAWVVLAGARSMSAQFAPGLIDHRREHR